MSLRCTHARSRPPSRGCGLTKGMARGSKMTSGYGVSVVVPVYGDGSALAELVARTDAALREAQENWELIFVNDGSVGPAWERIRELAASSRRVRGIDLVRNFGQHNAVLAGIRASRGEVIV